jgi:hypothetical protein
MNRRQLELIVTLPWLAASVVLLLMTRIAGETQAAKLGLLGSAAICFSIGCLARTSLAIHDLAARNAASGAQSHDRPVDAPHGS